MMNNPNLQHAVLATLIVAIGSIPLAHYLTADRRDRQLNSLRNRLRQNGWICMQRGQAGELWGRTIIIKNPYERLRDDRFLIPAKIGPFTLESLQRALAKIEEEDRRA